MALISQQGERVDLSPEKIKFSERIEEFQKGIVQKMVTKLKRRVGEAYSDICNEGGSTFKVWLLKHLGQICSVVQQLIWTDTA